MIKRRKSYTAAYKLEVVEYSDNYGILGASRHYNINDRLIRKWRSSRNSLMYMKPTRRASRGPNAMYPELEEKLRDWVLQERQAQRSVSTVRVRAQAILMAKVKGYSNFLATPNWCYKFMKRNQLSIRAKTSNGQHLPDDYVNKQQDFRNFVFDEIQEVQPRDLGNMDEVAVAFDIPKRFTVEEKGKEDVFIRTTGNEKSNFTVVLSVSSDGTKCPPFIIFKKKNVPKNLPAGVIVKANKNGWMTDELITNWIEECWQIEESSLCYCLYMGQGEF